MKWADSARSASGGQMNLLAGLAVAALLVGCHAPSGSPDCPGGSERQVVATEAAPPAVGPYSQAVVAGCTLYAAGQIGLDPETGELVDGGIEAETRQVMHNLGAVLEAAGYSFDDVVQAQLFLADLDDFATVNAIYATYFGDTPPARATVEVSRIPLDARIEIMLTAHR